MRQKEISENTIDKIAKHINIRVQQTPRVSVISKESTTSPQYFDNNSYLIK